MTGRVQGKTALVTGAAQGLGEAIARKLAAEGARVALTDIKVEQVRAVAASIDAEHGAGAAFAYAHDVADEQAWIDVLAQAVPALGGLSILVNNAGIGTRDDLETLELSTWKGVMAVNVDSVFLGCKHALPHLRANAPASIVNISSIAGIIAQGDHPAYNASKAAVLHLSKSVALYCQRKGYDVRCNSVHPAFVDTPILDPLRQWKGREKIDEALARANPMQRLGRPEEIAAGVLFLASDESSFMTAAELKLDGGISAA